MEGGGNGGGDGDGGRRRVKKTIRRRQAGKGSSTAAHEDPPAVLMEEDIAAAAPGEDEPVGPKKWGRDKPCVAFKKATARPVATLILKATGLPVSCGPGSGGQLSRQSTDVVRITGLRVDGQAVTGVTYTSYQELAERLLGLDVTRERSSLISRTGLWASLGVVRARHQTGESQADYMARMTEDARAALAEEEGAAADRDLRRFLIIVIGRLILGTRGDPVSCRCLPLLEDLSSVGSYAWGAALLAHLFDSLGTSSRVTGVAGFFPLLQVWAYHHLPSLGRGEPRRAGEVPLLQCWRFRRDEQSLRRQVTMIHDALDSVPFSHVQWTPYVGEDDAAQPWVKQGRPYFGRDIWLHSFNTVVPLHHRLVARTLGLHQSVVEFPTRQRPWERPGRSFRGIQQETDWTVWIREQHTDWEQRGREVVSEATSDEDYYRAYARRYGTQVYKGSRRPFDPKGRIASLEGILHSTIQQRDDLQVVVDQLREELEWAQQMVGGASSSREDPGRSVSEGQLAAAVARAEDALTQAREREVELRDSLARTTALEAEMAELRLRPEAAEVTHGVRRPRRRRGCVLRPGTSALSWERRDIAASCCGPR
ncbi:hypothetical protein Taro_019131 [Colocasia esculenta]|uniref:Aminotransferase-like plant mobile domain-containing protein n=1 Tax=Colocasia esculenta TaxID=4460 RepID=A0A843UT53_COLES|nr:hypothetical protein [Colocasia esculenta]